jgi:hypothetical protein
MSTNQVFGRVYVIRSDRTPKVYVGSTVAELKTRFSAHKSMYKYHVERGDRWPTTSTEILKFPDARIEALEEGMFPTLGKLREREGYWIRRLNTVNKHVPLRNPKMTRCEVCDCEVRNIKEHERSARHERFAANPTLPRRKDRNAKHTCACGTKVTNRNREAHLETKLHRKRLVDTYQQAVATPLPMVDSADIDDTW